MFLSMFLNRLVISNLCVVHVLRNHYNEKATKLLELLITEKIKLAMWKVYECDSPIYLESSNITLSKFASKVTTHFGTLLVTTINYFCIEKVTKNLSKLLTLNKFAFLRSY